MRIRQLLVAAFMVLLVAQGAWAESLTVKGSTTVLPIMQKSVEAYMKANPDVDISVSGGGSGNGIKAIIDGTTDIAMASRFMKGKEVTLAMEKGVYPVPFAVGIDALVPVVHPTNPVADLSDTQLRDIFAGRITNWKELGGPDKEIVVISRDTSSGTYETWEEKIMHKDRVFAGALLQASNGAVVQAVSKNRYAIGYIGYGYLDASTKALKVSGIEGNPETAASGKYPIARYLYIFTNGWPEGELAKFVMYLLNPRQGQVHVKDAGYVPLY
ncbi:phosphate transport system substrate-binding protein [Desulfobaculum xiamenense]|uniref:Phosphate-binding protein n=1 Tax=Desulfobaculum xiamenense TaxID=995050 RepID=A0A846QPZ9_9BACT|nr:phosphate ABC transporter substrate-binding protein [Desulfobaculum xiamenense]NJB69060.1 phosphate transport system substrate-binding protein [Desulfobaculum xiamenense]